MKRVLIVDDDRDLANVLKIRLEKECQFEVRTVSGGHEALQVVREDPPDMILMDVLMPRIDGLSTLKELKRATPKKIPVIIMTAKATMTKEAFELEGAVDFFVKPVDGKALISRMNEILNSK